MGGSFNPPTLGHLELAQLVLLSSEVEEVWVVPCCIHLQKDEMTNPTHRLAMCELAFKGSDINVCDYEIKHNLDGSAFDFVTKLLKDESMQDYEFKYIVGMDNAENILTWKKTKELMALISFIVVPRDGLYRSSDTIDDNPWYKQEPHVFIDKKVRNVSSTIVREWLKNGFDPHWASISEERLGQEMNAEVLKYINENHLYEGRTSG